MDPNMLNYLLSFASSVTWDLLKKLYNEKIDNSPERKSMLALAATMESFFNYLDFEYDEDIVMDSFLSAVNRHKDMTWKLRNIIEDTIGQTITDEAFAWWVENYHNRIPWAEKAFTDRDRVRERIKYKLKIKNNPCYGEYSQYVDQTVEAFNYSWKKDVISLLSPLKLNLSFANHSENYDVILAAFRDLHIEWCQLEQEKRRSLRNLLDFPNFNKVLLLSGTSGSGKTHFVEEYEKMARQEFGNIPIPCHVDAFSINNLYEEILLSLRGLLEVECNSFEIFDKLLDALNLKITFVIENVNALLNEDWNRVVNIIKTIVRYDHFTFIISINSYEYYQVEKETDFLKRYCIRIDKASILQNCLSIDEVNKRQDIVRTILLEYGIDSIFEAGITTPQEAIYYGQCAQNSHDVNPPSSYYEYIERIVRWKENQIAGTSIGPLLNVITTQKTSVIKTELNIASLRLAQLLTKERNSSIFTVTPTYHLRIYPYWAVKIIGFNSENLLEYSDDLKEWLVSCFIFYRYQNSIGIEDVQQFFMDLASKGLLDYAVFCAHKADNRFIRELKCFLLESDIVAPRQCYAVLRFVVQCPLKNAEKFELCAHMAKGIKENGLVDIFGRTLDVILENTSKAKNLRKDFLSLVSCDEISINHISGYKIGGRYMMLIKDYKIHDLVWNIILFIRQNKLEDYIGDRKNTSFLDYFLRKCFEDHIGKSRETLQTFYDEMGSLFSLDAPIGPFVKRNMTCAVGNLFENNKDKYLKEYLEVTRNFADADEIYDRLTAWYLISNSVGAKNTDLDENLAEILTDLMTDVEIMERVGMEIDEFLRKQIL